MTRTTIVLPDEIKRLAVRNAQFEGISFGEFVRRALELSLKGKDEKKKSYDRSMDSLFSTMKTLSRKTVPCVKDASSNHDEYLYGGG